MLTTTPHKMAMSYVTLLLAFAVGQVMAVLPNGWKACKQSSADYEDCLKEQIQSAMHSLRDGDKGLGILPLDPYRILQANLEQGSGPVVLKLSLKDADFKGFAAATVTRVKNDWKKMSIELEIPHLTLEGAYSMKGKIMVLPVEGEGRCSMIWENVKFKFDMDINETKNMGKSYFQISQMQVDANMTRATFKFDNLFNGNKELGDNMNKFMNENWQVLIEEMHPPTSKALGTGFSRYINKILEKIPAQEINVK